MFRNAVKTVVLLAAIGALFMVVGSFFGPQGLVIGLVLGLVFVGGSYWFSDKLAVRASATSPRAPACRCPRSTSARPRSPTRSRRAAARSTPRLP
jgi:hypothetical protein